MKLGVPGAVGAVVSAAACAAGAGVSDIAAATRRVSAACGHRGLTWDAGMADVSSEVRSYRY
ncbi:hypothetical protein GCM10009662_30420 [Catellatospora coxensis]|uniref:Uncharacterized protein n=1 Tax=Catellatospora coxensis TaxID=310354 RepID=A0A8J3KSC9_9ACTN|nr:hypothetical protein Cco03nite_29600 [Catellatospora coxensis]